MGGAFIAPWRAVSGRSHRPRPRDRRRRPRWQSLRCPQFASCRRPVASTGSPLAPRVPAQEWCSRSRPPAPRAIPSKAQSRSATIAWAGPVRSRRGRAGCPPGVDRTAQAGRDRVGRLDWQASPPPSPRPRGPLSERWGCLRLITSGHERHGAHGRLLAVRVAEQEVDRAGLNVAKGSGGGETVGCRQHGARADQRARAESSELGLQSADREPRTRLSHRPEHGQSRRRCQAAWTAKFAVRSHRRPQPWRTSSATVSLAGKGVQGAFAIVRHPRAAWGVRPRPGLRVRPVAVCRSCRTHAGGACERWPARPRAVGPRPAVRHP